MIRLPLQNITHYTDGGFLQAALADLAAATGGQEVFGLLAGSVLLLAFYLASNGRMATVAALTTLSGGVLIASLPPGFQRMAQVIIFLGLVSALYAGFDKFVDQTP